MQCRYIVSARLQSVKVGAASGVVFSGVHFQLCEALQSCCHNGDTDATHTGMQGPLQCSSSISTAAAGEKIARCAAHSLCRYADNMRPFLHIIFLLNCHHCCLVLMHKIFHCRKGGQLDLHLDGGEFQSYIGDVIWSDGACRR